MGRLSKPEELHRLAGNPSKKKVKKTTPRAKNLPFPPEGMTTLGQIIWKRVVASMPSNVYTAADSNALASYCEAVARHHEAVEAFGAKPELLSTGSTGQIVENPLLKIMRSQAQLMNQLGARLGLDPVARQQLNTGPEEQHDEFAGLIN